MPEPKLMIDRIYEEIDRRAKWKARRQLFYMACATLAVCSLIWIAYRA